LSRDYRGRAQNLLWLLGGIVCVLIIDFDLLISGLCFRSTTINGFTHPKYSIFCIDEILRCQYLTAARNLRHCLEEARRPASYLRLYD
jgi:hypothetical protein